MSALNFSEKEEEEEEEEEENQQDISRSGVTRVLQTLHPNTILSRVTTNMLTLATKNILE